MTDCRYCQRPFEASRYHPQQTVCSDAECQSRRRADARRRKLEIDEVYRQTVRNSQEKWRSLNPGYWKRYRRDHPKLVERNREQQRRRDARRRLEHLAKNNVAIDLKTMAAEVWLLGGPEAGDLAKNNVASAKVFIYQAQAP